MRCKATELTDVTLGSCGDQTKKGAQKSSMETEKKGGEGHGGKNRSMWCQGSQTGKGFKNMRVVDYIQGHCM